MPKRKRTAYEAAFKLKVIEYAKAHNNCAAEREFGVSEKIVRDWRKKKESLALAPKTEKRRVIRLSPYEDLEKDIETWISELRQSGYAVTRNGIRLKARKLAEDKKYCIKPGTFKASAGWCSRFMNRRGLSIRQRTHIAQKLPSDVENKLTSFQTYVIRAREEMKYELSQIGNMDETPMFFDMPSTSTVHAVGEKTISIKTTGSEKAHFTTILACMADGTKLKPAVVFKRKTMPKDKFPPGILVFVNEKGWVDESIVISWLEKVWFKRPGGLLNKPSLLVWDMFRAHLTARVKEHLQARKVRQAVIPGGCTSLLQPLDVSLNKPFKCAVRELWNDWMVSGTQERTKAGNLKRPSIVTVSEWVVKAWESIEPEMIVKSFLKCGISNSLDGSEDDALYSDMVAGSADACRDDNVDSELDDSYVYSTELTYEQCREFFDSDNDSDGEFEGF